MILLINGVMAIVNDRNDNGNINEILMIMNNSINDNNETNQ
jgi:hypothetical protein